jgi:hypothetical protein
MRSAIIAAFGEGIADNCLVTTNVSHFEILDPSSDDGDIQVKCELVFPPVRGHFLVDNPEKISIHFLAIDHCLPIEKGRRRCDFVIFDAVKIYFADIKKVTRQNRAKARSDAREQLFETIKLFSESLDMGNFKIIAVIALTFKQTYPAATVASQDAKIRFQDALNADLLEGNQISF